MVQSSSGAKVGVGQGKEDGNGWWVLGPDGKYLGAGGKNMGFEESSTLGKNERLLSQALDKSICRLYLVSEDDCKHPSRTNPVCSRSGRQGLGDPSLGLREPAGQWGQARVHP